MIIVKFYQLKVPEYKSDMESSRKNPAKMIVDYYIPCIECPICGPWGGLGRVYHDVCDNFDERNFKGIRHLSAADWLEKRRGWAEHFGVPEETIRPGDRLGLPKGRIRTEKYLDFIFVYPLFIWITERVYLALKEHDVTGASFYQVQMQYKGYEYTKIKFYEICAKSLERRKITTKNKNIMCDVCKRRKAPICETLVVDSSCWSGSDIFDVDLHSNRILISERVKAIFEEYQFTNYRLIPVESA